MLRSVWGLAYVAALLLSPVSGPAWRGVVSDWVDDNRFNRLHSCPAVVVAATRLAGFSTPAGYTRMFDDLKVEARRVCRPGHPALIRIGMSDAAVVAVAGKPRLRLSGPNCWVYPTRRVCFASARVTRIQLVEHG